MYSAKLIFYRVFSCLLFLPSFINFASAELAPDSRVIKVTYSDLNKDPWHYHGKKILIEGEFDDCLLTNCAICEPTITQRENGNLYLDECMGVTFGENDFLLHPSSIPQIVRHTHSTIEATYNAFCMNGTPPSNMSVVKYKGKDKLTFCGHSEAELRDAKLLKVNKRKRSRDGLTRFGVHVLHAASHQDAKELYAVFSDAMSFNLKTILGEKDQWRKFAFVYQLKNQQERNEPEQRGGVCICRTLFEECNEENWEPQISAHIFGRSALDMYTCYHAEKSRGLWQFKLIP